MMPPQAIAAMTQVAVAPSAPSTPPPKALKRVSMGAMVWPVVTHQAAPRQTIAPMDTRFKAFGGGVEGALGATATWVIAAIACGGIIVALGLARRRRLRFGFPVRPGWADAVIAAFACVAVLGAAAIANAYPLPAGTARRWAEANGIAWPEGGLFIPHGVALPVLIAVVVGLAMTFIATRRASAAMSSPSAAIPRRRNCLASTPAGRS